MKLLSLLFFVIIILNFSSKSEELYFPPLTGSQWETINATELGWNINNIDTLYSFLESKKTKAFLILKNGKIVLEKYFGTFGKDSIWYWASAAKTITATLIGIAQKEGYLSINDRTSKHLGEGWTISPKEKEDLITIRHQLTMTTGLDDGIPNSFCTDDTCLKYLADAGSRWAYHNAPYTLLEKIIANATSKSINEYFTEKIFRKTGMSGLFVKVGYNNIFFSIPRSMARFGLLILNKGYWENTPILEDMNYYYDMINTSQSLNESYGYLWWLNGKKSYMVPGLQVRFQGMLFPDAPPDMISAMGKNAQLLNIVPSQNLIVIRMGEAPSDSEIEVFRMNNEIWKFLNQIINTNVSVNKYDNHSLFIEQDKINGDLKIFTEFECRIKIFDLLGRLIFSEFSNARKVIKTNYLPTGIYFIAIEANSESYKIYKIFVK